MKYFVFRVYQGCDSDDNYEIRIQSDTLSDAWLKLPSEVVYLNHVRAFEFINAYEL